MPSPAAPKLRFAPIAHPHALNVRSGVAMAAKPCLGAAGCGLESKLHFNMASHGTHMLRFASCRASSRTYMCVPESRQSRSLAYERRAAPYAMGLRQTLVCCVSRRHVLPHALYVRSGVTRLAKPCLRASGCVPSRSTIANANPVVPDALCASRDLDTHPRTVYGVGADSRPRTTGRLQSGAKPPTQPNQNTK